MRACFINPPLEDFYATGIRRQPLGLLSVAASVRAAGHDVRLINGHTPKRKVLPLPDAFSYLQEFIGHDDARYAFPFSHYSRYGMDFDEIRLRIRESATDVFFLSCLFTTYHEEAERIVEIIRNERPGVPIVCGGYHASLHAAYFLEELAVDAVVAGEGEYAAAAYMEFLGGKRRIDEVPNCRYRSGGAAACTQPRVQENLDDLAAPARDLLLPRDFRMYRSVGASLVASRGCPNRCSFCTSRLMWGGSYRRRSVESLVREIDGLYHENGVRWFNFEDDNLFPRSDEAGALLDSLIEYRRSCGEEIQFTAMNGISLESLNDDILAKMSEAGFREINMSLVSHSAALQSTLRRPFSSGTFAKIAQGAKRRGLAVRAYFILGLPSQTKEELEETIAFLESLAVPAFPSVYYDVTAPRREWKMQRSSAFYNETAHLSRRELLFYFNRIMRS